MDNIDVQGQLKIEEESMSNEVDKSPGPPGIYPTLPREVREEIAGALIFASSPTTGNSNLLNNWYSAFLQESNAQSNYSLGAMGRGQSEIPPLQWHEEYSVNGDGRKTEAAPGLLE